MSTGRVMLWMKHTRYAYKRDPSCSSHDALMPMSFEALTFTNTLLSTIRIQRHLGARIIISTLEPSISSALL
jgi:hypothetical protein